ncbi:hypothetical protein [Salinimicrobium sp. GXAS 041]|uniref:hypothetical protein n=1 Tax=Salinimicrobium sp. GXAS 041 TaxID=3400806 RepID=UPI003C72790B
MKILKNIFLAGVLFIGFHTFAQAEDVKKANAEATEMNEQAMALDTTIKTTQNTVNTLKNTFGGIFGSGKNKKETVIAFAGLQFGDEKLSLVFNELKEMKGVKDVSTKIDHGIVKMVVKSKKGVFEIWENFSPQVKEMFKMVQASDKNVLVQLQPESTPTPTTQVQVTEAGSDDQ